MAVDMKLPLLLRMLEKARLFGESGDPRQIVMLGWLELPWDPAAEMIIGGLNEGLVPESISSDAWLPHHERAKLGLRTNEDRLARDAFLLTSLLESRRRPGASLTVLAGRVSADNEPLKPSRLLVQCPIEELAGRVAMLFPKEVEETEDKPAPAWNLAWKLKLPPLDPASTGAIIRKIGVTQLRSWLDCPFRYYLRYVLKMEKFETSTDELDARAFGDLCHHALMQMAKDPAINASAEAKDITDYLQKEVDAYFASRYGYELSVPLIIQRETARNRLAAAAEIHAQSRADGWRVLHAEKRIEEILGEKWIIDNVEIRGQIDLIEQHQTTGDWRILDYKTASKSKKPEEAHLKVISSRSKREDPDWMVWRNGAGKPARWIDLQLPLYALALQKKFGKAGAAAYLNLPAALGSSEISHWEDITDSALLTSAEACAKQVIRKIADGIFWPPTEKPAYDDYKHLFFSTPMESVDFTEMQDYRLALEAR
jgi:ATP-dependent helicase/nuclease subunit B